MRLWQGIITRPTAAPCGRKFRRTQGTVLPGSAKGIPSGEFDEQTGLYNFRARMYDSDLGIFYGADPAGQGYAAYAYCGNNPVMRIDKDGKEFFTILAIAAAIGGTINTYHKYR